MSDGALAQRRHLDGDDVEAVVEVLAELPVARPSRCRSRFVAAMTRTSTLIVSLPPTRSNSRSCRKRSSLTWIAGEISPISSRNSVPPSACWKRPSRRADRAGERAALVAEQLALEQRLGQRRAVQLHERARCARGLRSWMAAAMSSLPVPLSPVMSTRGARRRDLRRRSRTPPASAGALPTMLLEALRSRSRSRSWPASRRSRCRSSSRVEHDRAARRSRAAWSGSRRAPVAHRRDRASRPSPNAVITTTGSSGSCARAALRQQLEAVHARHLEVGEHHVGREAPRACRAP